MVDALARTVRLSVDRPRIDSQRLCLTCFAAWIDRYETEMTPARGPMDSAADPESEMIVD